MWEGRSIVTPIEAMGVVRALIMLCPFVILVYCVWMLDRGFEITDEAYYLLLAIHAGLFKFYISAQQWLTAGLWQVTGSITMFRAAGMILLTAGSALLGLGVFSACLCLGLVEDRLESRCVVLAGSIVGAMLYASTINLSPCYNLLASAGAYAATGMALLALNCPGIFRRYVLFVLAGAAVAVEALCKPPAGIATLILLVLWVMIMEGSHPGKLSGSMAMTLGTFIFTCVALLANTTISEATQAFEQGMELFRMVQTETIGTRLLRYVFDYWGHLLIILKWFALPIAAMIVYAITRRVVFAALGLIALVFSLICGRYLCGGWNADGSFTTPAAILSMLAMVLIVSMPVWNKDRKTLALFAGLILHPYAVAVGTGNTLFTQVIDSLAPWGVAVAVPLVAHHYDDGRKVTASLIGLCFMATVTLNIVTSCFRPYHLSLPLTQQDHVISVGGIGKVRVDAGTYRFLMEVKEAVEACDIRPGAPFIGLYNIPGVAIALQAIPVSTPWLNNREQAAFILERTPLEGLHEVVLAFQTGDDMASPQLPQQLASFPSGYRYCGMATYPYAEQRIKIWQSQSRQPRH